MTINKSRDQSLKHVEIYLQTFMFLHDQLYAAISRVTLREGLMIFIADIHCEYGRVKCQMWSIEKYFVIYDN